MARILFNMPSQFAGRPSGVARVAFQLLDHLIGGSEFEYALRSPWSRDQLPESLQAKPLDVVTVPRFSKAIVDVIRQGLTFPAYCRREEIDLVVNLDPFGAPAGGRARLMIVHDLYFRTIPDQIGLRALWTNDLIFRLMLRGNSKIVTVSDATKRDLEYWYPQSKGRATTIHSATSFEPLHNARPASEIPGRYVLAVGNVTKNKNFLVLAKAMTRIGSLFPDVGLVHVGNDRHDTLSLSQAFKDLGSSLRVIRLAGIGDERLAGLYANASCLCVPSLYEGFCLPVLEAQVCGCPVICSNTSATPEVAGRGALLFDPTDPDALADCLKEVLSVPETSDRLKRLGHENAAKFSWNVAARSYEDTFRSMLRSK